MKKTYYEKVGKRYKPVAEYDSTFSSAFRKGHSLVVCYDGGRTTYFDIDPAYAPMIAAYNRSADEICRTIIEKMNSCTDKEMTPRQKKAWDELQEAYDGNLTRLTSPSVHDCVEKGMKLMQVEAIKLLTTPALKAAYDQFLLIAALSKEDDKNDQF